MNPDPKNLARAYHQMEEESFPDRIELVFGNGDESQRLSLEKVTWSINGVRRGLRYGENPEQPAALYRLRQGQVSLDGLQTVAPGAAALSDMTLIQSGKHPGKTNITDIDSALTILCHLPHTPCAVIVKHNIPAGVACAATIGEACHRALMADRIAAFGSTVALNRPVDRQTAAEICQHYTEVVAAPDFEPASLELFARRRNLRVVQFGDTLARLAKSRTLEFRSLADGGIIVQWSYQSRIGAPSDFLPAVAQRRAESHPTDYRVQRAASAEQLDDLLFGWRVIGAAISNSIIYVKDGATVGICAGQQDRVGAARFARDKAYRAMADRLCFERVGLGYEQCQDDATRRAIWNEVQEARGGLRGSCMISDAFFPFRDTVDVASNEGVAAIVQPGGSIRDWESIEACNEHDIAMVFTGQRSFRH